MGANSRLGTHSNKYSIRAGHCQCTGICCRLICFLGPSLTMFKMSTVTKNLLFRSIQNNFSNVQTYLKHLCQWSDTVGYSIQTLYTCQLFLSQMHEILPCHDWDFQKSPGDFQRFPTTFRRLLNIAKNVRRCSEDIWVLLKLLKRQQF